MTNRLHGRVFSVIPIISKRKQQCRGKFLLKEETSCRARLGLAQPSAVSGWGLRGLERDKQINTAKSIDEKNVQFMFVT